MDERVNRIAATANRTAYEGEDAFAYINGAPHIKHETLRKLYGALVVRVFDTARLHVGVPKVLDLGAGEGSATLPFLELGARVVAVDISDRQLQALKQRCGDYGHMLDIRVADVSSVLDDKSERFDIVVANSFLHHVPDYLGMVENAITVLGPHGQFFSFQDPMRYDRLGRATRAFCEVAYGFWRVFQGDVMGGLARRARRARGVYLRDSVHDNTEYHFTRNGVDQDAIEVLFRQHGFVCHLIRYFSTQSVLFQEIGERLGARNTFAIVAERVDRISGSSG